jgi:peroxiredoxin
MAFFISMGIVLSGCISSGNGADDGTAFPDFSADGDDGETYALSDYSGFPFIVLFSAEWCDAPCHSTMHAINSTLEGHTLIVMSTDPQESPQGVSLQDWHEKASASDDTENDIGQTLDFPFMKGVEVSQDLGISARPTIVFVNAEGTITTTHKGGLIDETKINGYWNLTSGTT